MQTVTLSEAALAMLRLHVEQDNIRIDDSNREADGGVPIMPGLRRKKSAMRRKVFIPPAYFSRILGHTRSQPRGKRVADARVTETTRLSEPRCLKFRAHSAGTDALSAW